MEYLHIGFKGMHPSKACWIEKEKVREKFPHQLDDKDFGSQKSH